MPYPHRFWKVSRISAPPRVTDYLIYNEVGEGPYAKVYSVRHKTCGLDLAMKVVSKELLEGQSTQPGAVSRLFEVVEEARLLRVTQSPFALGLKAAFHDDANFYIVTKLCRTTLYDALKISAGSLSEYTMKLYIAELTCGISHLHQQGIIHRDIKLENTLIANDGHIVIADMGMAVQVETESANSPALRRVFGTPGYVAYEVVACEPYTYSVDWFSLGVIIHLLYTGEVRSSECCALEALTLWYPAPLVLRKVR
ncbi:kinase-like domain-containing protein [Amylostereum chailletii]|nr:kinase-like domain-containing protein [Amylostereum chailletii]